MDKAPMDEGPQPRGIRLGQFVLALDSTLVTLAEAPRGLDVAVASAALIDPDDLRLPLAPGARASDVFLIVGADETKLIDWLAGFDDGRPVAVLAKSASRTLIDAAAERGVAVIDVDPRARWERIYNLIVGVLENAHNGAGRGAESMRAGSVGDLFDLAAEVARRTRGLISIEDSSSHVLAYSSAGDAADELRRLSILGREGPAEMLAWLRGWGVMDALRTSNAVVSVEERVDLGLRPRLAAPIRNGDTFLGVVWLQQGHDPLAEDAATILTGAAAVAARVISRRRVAGSGHDDLVRRLLGVRGAGNGGSGRDIDADHLGSELGIDPSSPVSIVGFGGLDANPAAPPAGARSMLTTPVVSALTLHASALSPLSVTTTIGLRAYVVLPEVDEADALRWAETAVTAAARQFNLTARAVVGGPVGGLAAVPGLRGDVDRVLDAAQRIAHSEDAALIEPVATVADSQTGVLLGEIVALLTSHPELVDSRVVALVDRDARTGSDFSVSLRTYLDHFGDVRAAADALHVHPNTLRYRIRRIRELTGMDLDDAATRLVVALALRTH